jgi:hypothetical protein
MFAGEEHLGPEPLRDAFDQFAVDYQVTCRLVGARTGEERLADPRDRRRR